MVLDSVLVKNLAYQAGFDVCGICKAEVSQQHKDFFIKWLDSGFNAGMKYLSEHQNLRLNPSELFPGAKSVISVALNYYPENEISNRKHFISKYAYGKDYHDIMRSRLLDLQDKIKLSFPNINMRIFVDTAPILERYFAMSAGLGFIGKNSCIINPDYGSYVFLGEIITDAEFENDAPSVESCESCQLCIDSCPVGALSADGLDARKCISYHTIESKSEIPKEIAARMTGQVFGCDICQDVCPHNINAQKTKCSDFKIHPEVDGLDYKTICEMSNREFNRRFAGTSLIRAGRKKIVGNFGG